VVCELLHPTHRLDGSCAASAQRRSAHGGDDASTSHEHLGLNSELRCAPSHAPGAAAPRCRRPAAPLPHAFVQKLLTAPPTHVPPPHGGLTPRAASHSTLSCSLVAACGPLQTPVIATAAARRQKLRRLVAGGRRRSGCGGQVQAGQDPPSAAEERGVCGGCSCRVGSIGTVGTPGHVQRTRNIGSRTQGSIHQPICEIAERRPLSHLCLARLL
jgi:hypothetical protein